MLLRRLRAMLLVAGVLCHAPGLGVPFLHDDRPAIVENRALRSLGQAWRAPPDSPLAGRPVVAWSFALNYQLGGLVVWGYHAANIGLHLASGLLLLSLVRRTLEGSAVAAAGHAANVAFLIALLWLVHPLQTEAVAYLSQRTELCMAFFFLATLYAARRAWGSPRPRRWIALAAIASAMGMASKEVMVVAPLVVLLYDRAFLFASLRAAWRARRPLYAALAATWLILVALVAGGPRSATAGLGTGIGPWHYLLTQTEVILWYLRLAFWPHPLSISYHWPLVTTLAEAWPAALLLCAMLGGSLWAWRRWPAVGLLGCGFFLVLAPTSSVVPIATEIAAERRMYLPLATVSTGVVLALAWLLPRRALWIGVLLVATALGLTTIVRLGDYRTEVSIWRAALRCQPRNPSAWANLGAALLSADDPDGADAALRRSLVLRPGHASTIANLALAQERRGRSAQAIATLEALLHLDPRHAAAHGRLGAIHARGGLRDEAAAHLSEAVRLDPHQAEAWHNLGSLLLGGDDPAAALPCFERAARLAPDDPQIHAALGRTLTDLDRFQEAERHLRRALSLDPQLASAHNFLGIVFARTGRLDDAERRFRTAVELRPDDAEARANLERVRGMLPSR